MLDVYDSDRTESPAEVLPSLRELLNREPLLLEAGPEELADRTGASPWATELAREALTLAGEVLA